MSTPKPERGNLMREPGKSKIEVLKITELPSGKSLRGFASVRLFDSLVIHDFRIVQQPDKPAWVAPPQKEIQSRGERRFVQLVEPDPDLKRDIEAAVLKAWRAAGKRGFEEPEGGEYPDDSGEIPF